MKVHFPERLGRRMSIGPFEQPRDFLRFMVFASVGALVSLGVGLLWGLPIIASGALLTMVRRDEEPLLSHLLRRVAYCFSSSRAPPSLGHLTHFGWKDTWGREWRFYEHTPYPIYGKSPEELLDTSMGVAKLLASTAGETLFFRETVPWDMGPYLPKIGRNETPAMIGYVALLAVASRGRYRSRLILGVPVSKGRTGSLATLLVQEGWRLLSGKDLISTLRRNFPLFGGA